VVAARCSAEDGSDLVSRFLDAIDPARDAAAAADLSPREVP
jgi:hypothetical protein